MRLFVITMLFFGINTQLYAQELKPGTPEWDRHFEELKRKGEKLARESKSGSNKSTRTTTLQSRAGSAKLKAELNRDREEAARQRDKEEVNALPAKYRKAFADAQHPADFQRDQVSSVEDSIQQLQKAVADAKKLDDIIPYLSAPFRKRFLLKLSGQNSGYESKSPEEDLAEYKKFFASITHYDTSAGSANENIAYGYVWTKDQSEVLYQIELVGEGRHWRLNAWNAQLLRQ